MFEKGKPYLSMADFELLTAARREVADEIIGKITEDVLRYMKKENLKTYLHDYDDYFQEIYFNLFKLKQKDLEHIRKGEECFPAIIYIGEIISYIEDRKEEKFEDTYKRRTLRNNKYSINELAAYVLTNRLFEDLFA